MTPSIGLKWPIDSNTIPGGVAIYASGDIAKRLLAASNEDEFRLERGRIIAGGSTTYDPEVGQLVERLVRSTPQPNQYRAVCRLSASDVDDYDVCVTVYPGNRSNYDQVRDTIIQTLYPETNIHEVTVSYLR